MKFDKPIALAADHGGYELKEAIKAHLDELGVAYTDFGTDSTASVDYPDFAAKGCKAVQDGSCALVILCCGNNINQIARKANAGFASREETTRALRMLDEVYGLLYEVAKR